MNLMRDGRRASATSTADTDTAEETKDDDALDLECGLGAPLTRRAGARDIERRRLERELVMQFDSRDLARNDAWFLVETPWLDAWMAYVLSDDGDPDCPVTRPGPLTNDSLFDRAEFRVKKGLQKTKHYRGVNPQVYALYTELYGDGGAKPIVRWTLDMYAMPVMIDDVKAMLHAPELRARVAVSELNELFETRSGPPRRRKDAEEGWVYRCLCRCEFLVPCLHRLLGGGPTYKKEERSTKWCGCCSSKEKQQKNKRRKKRNGKKKRKTQEDDEGDDEDSEASSSDEETQGLLG
ncbi:hypothetical protein BBJ28_00007272 [Nothophytophthora sp. Chile5]|nr:hypothetical protein BBJ28_00007272 [Nothophytophthora sp. Chile5]